MKFLTRCVSLLLLGLAAGVSTAGAQELTRDRVLFALDRTDERIAQAEVAVTGSANASAQAEIDQAIRIQTSARAEFALDHLRISFDLTTRARAHADRAIAIVRGLPDPDRIQAQLERTRELLERSRERIEDCGNDRARSMLRAALDMQVRAEASARDGRYLAALQLTMSARERTLKALRLCNMSENLRESAERALHRTDEVLSRARDAVSDCTREEARRALSRAVELQHQATVEFRAERFEASLRLTQSARAFAYRAIRVCRGA